MSNPTLRLRRAVAAFGATMLLGAGGNGEVRNVTITGGNETTGDSHYGGGFFFDSDSKNLTLDHVAIVGNSNCTDGGGLDFEGSTGTALTITHSTIANNASGGNGGAAWASGDGTTITIENSTVSAN